MAYGPLALILMRGVSYVGGGLNRKKAPVILVMAQHVRWSDGAF
jgi:hypothetical protein